MKRPDVSVVIATRERWPLLERTLEALAGQCLGDLEVEVVVADALSADGSWESLERFTTASAATPFALTVVQAAAFGGAAARNAAIAAADGDLLLLLADDACPAAATLVADHVRAHRGDGPPSAVSGGLAWHADADGSFLAATLLADGAVGDDRAWLGGPPALRVENCSVPRAALVAVDGFDERLTGWNVEGIELSWRLCDSGVALERDDRLLALRRSPPDAQRWLAEVQDVGRQCELLDRLHPARSTPGPRGAHAVLARGAYPLVRRRPGSSLAKRSALARGRGRPAIPALPERRGAIRGTGTGTGRPPVSVVVPFHGGLEDLRRLLAALSRLRTGPGDEVIVADNTPSRVSAECLPQPPLRLLHAAAEESAPHARNAGAEAASCDWVLFMDADCRPAPGLLDAYFHPSPPDEAGAVAGAILDPVDQPGLAARYSASRERLGQAALLAHPYMPAAVTANLMVRRRAWEELGGLCEGIRSEEDLDFCWRMQRAGWTLEYRQGAAVEHRHRETVSGLLAQARRFGRGFAWQDRRYPGSRITGHLLRPLPRLAATALWGLATLRWERAAFAVLDVAVATSEVSGRLRGGLAVASAPLARSHADVVFVVDRYGDVWNAPVTRDVRALEDAGTRVRVEAARRGSWFDRRALHGTRVSFAEDDGSVVRLGALARLLLRHPLRCAARRDRLLDLAPLAVRARRSGARHLHATGGGSAPEIAAGLATLTGLPFSAHVDGASEVAGHEPALRRAAFLTAPSGHGADALRSALGPGPPVHVVPHATPVLEASERRSAGTPSVVTLGRLEQCEGLRDLIAAIAVLRRRGTAVRLQLLGEGPCRRPLGEAAAASGVADLVELPGIRQPADALEELARADVVAIAAAPAREADWPPASALEGLSAGCALVGASHPALVELVTPQTGRLVEAGSPELLATAIEDLLDGAAKAVDRPGPGCRAAEPGRVASRLADLFS